jgi:hypothetical protein
MRHILGPESAFALLILAIALYLCSFRKPASATLILAGMILFYPLYKEFVLAIFPLWVAVLISVVTALFAARWILGLLLGSAADNTVGDLAAGALRSLAKLPAWLWTKLHLGQLIKNAGVGLGRGMYHSSKSVANAVQKKISKPVPDQSTDQTKSLTMTGTVVGLDDGFYYIKFDNDRIGQLVRTTTSQIFVLAQNVACTLAEVSTSGQLYVESATEIVAGEGEE